MEPTRFQLIALELQERLDAALSEVSRLKLENEALGREAVEWKQSFFRVQDALSRMESDLKTGLVKGDVQ